MNDWTKIDFTRCNNKKVSNAVLEQIRFWCQAVKDMQKGIDRKNKRINSLQKQNSRLIKLNADLRLELAEKLNREFKNSD